MEEKLIDPDLCLDEDLDDSLIEKSIQWENKILKEMNADLRENNQLLREKIDNLEMEIIDLRENSFQKNNPNDQKLLELIQTKQFAFDSKLESLMDLIISIKTQLGNKEPKRISDSPKVNKNTHDKNKYQSPKPATKTNTPDRQLLSTKNFPQQPKTSTKRNEEEILTKTIKDVQNTNSNKSEAKNMKSKTIGYSALQGVSNIQTNVLNTELLKIQTQQKCDEIINLAKNDNPPKGNDEDTNDENVLKTINKRRRHNVGRGDGDNELRGNKTSGKKYGFL